MDDPRQWLEQHAITEVECLVPDINGILRGKVHAGRQVAASLEGAPIFLPMSAFIVAVTGRYTGADEMAYQDPDTLLRPEWRRCAWRRALVRRRPMCWPMPIIPTAGRGRWRRATC